MEDICEKCEEYKKKIKRMKDAFEEIVFEYIPSVSIDEALDKYLLLLDDTGFEKLGRKALKKNQEQ